MCHWLLGIPVEVYRVKRFYHTIRLRILERRVIMMVSLEAVLQRFGNVWDVVVTMVILFSRHGVECYPPSERCHENDIENKHIVESHIFFWLGRVCLLNVRGVVWLFFYQYIII